MKPKVLVLSHSRLERDPRVFRQIRSLRDHYEVVTCGYSPSGFSDVRHIPLEPSELSRLDKLDLVWRLGLRAETLVSDRHPAVRATRRALQSAEFDILLVNDAISLPAVAPLLKGRPVYFDAHEYAPLEFEEKPIWKAFWSPYYRALCRSFLPLTSVRTTVCESIAQEYEREFGLPFEVIRNAPDFVELEPSPVPSDKVRLIHHGAAIRGRHLELMANLMSRLPERFELTLMLVPSDRAYYEELRELCRTNPRIRFMPPVPMPQIAREINAYDLGVFLLPENSFNNRYALPNKFFEFIQGRLGLVCGPSPEMSRLVRTLELGVATSSLDIDQMAQELSALSAEDIRRFKANSHRHARQCSYDAQKETFLRLFQKTSQKDPER